MMTIAGPKLEEVYQEFLTAKRVERRSANTFKQYETILLPFFEWLDGRPLTPAAVDGYLAALMDGWYPAARRPQDRKSRSDATIQKYARCLRTFVKFAARREHMDEFKVTMPEIKESTEKFALTMEQVKRLGDFLAIHQIRGGARIKHVYHRNELAFWLVLETGCRISEALSMTWADIDLKRGTVFIPAGKTKHNRYAALNTLWHKAQPLLEMEPDKTGPVLRTIKKVVAGDGKVVKPAGSALDYQGYRKFVDTLNENVDLGTRRNQHGRSEPVRFTAHDLRRTFITLALESGLPIPVVAQQVGHAQWSTTQLYSKTTTEQMVALFKKHNGN